MEKGIDHCGEEYKEAARVCRDVMRKAKFHLEVNVARDVRENKKGFFKCIGSKRKVRENEVLLLNERGALTTDHIKKAEFLNATFTSTFTAQTSP